MNKEAVNNFCYVCGFEFSKSICFEDMRYPFYECPCCFFEYGIEEFEYNVYTKKREKWIEDGSPFKVNECSPYKDGWTIEKAINQLSNLSNLKIHDKEFNKLNPNFNGYYDIELLKRNWKN